MKKKSAPQSAFFNLRVLIGLFVVFAGVFLALLGFGVFSAHAQQKNNIFTNSNDPLVPAGFDCSRIRDLGIDRQENLRAGAIMIACGEAQGGSVSPFGTFSQFVQNLLPSPLAFGTADVNLITGTQTSPNITQSETFTASNPDNPLQIVVAYNDSRGSNAVPINFSGASVSTDGGTTFARLTGANGQSPFSNTLGDPVILYNRPSGTWYTVWLDKGCGSQGLGGYKSTTPWSANSWTHYCIHTNSQDDRESGWADNNPSSPFYGRMYVSWNDFNVGGGAIFARYSTDNGLTWTNQRQVTTTFYRNVQITGDLATGALYIAAMDEMGGGLGNRANRLYRSTDGGNTWTNTYVGPTFAGPGRGASGYFATMYDNPAYWRHMGWGEPAALNGVVHYVYAARNTGNGDPGNVFYIRSTDAGVTFSTPFMLNTNTDATKAQWQPNLSVAANGSLFAVWYDERERVAASCQPSSPSTPCYRMWARRSADNGATWLADMAFSDVVTPLPLQPDPGIVGVYAGDYDYGSSVPTQHLSAWVDGRVAINSASQQDAFHDKQSLGQPTPTPTPTPTVTPTPTATPCLVPSTLSLNPATVTGGSNSVATVTLTAPAPAGGLVVILSSSNPAVAMVPGSVTVLSESSSATFTVNTTAVAGVTPVTIRASAGLVTKTAILTVVPAAPAYQGYFEDVYCEYVQGWAKNANFPNTPITVDILADGVLVANFLADASRADVGNHGFFFPLPVSLKDGRSHSFIVRFGGTTTPLPPLGHTTVTCNNAEQALALDIHPSGYSTNLNGVFEPGETVQLEPSWKNTSTAPLTLAGTITLFFGPLGPTYTITDASANYGTIQPGITTNCYSATGDCYKLTISNPNTRPATHWDAFADETFGSGNSKRWTLHVGRSFTDVATTHKFYLSVETIFHKGITAGCTSTTYCPDSSLTRAEMAVFLLKEEHGASYVPPPAVGIFTDVPPGSFAADWIEQLYREGITAGCGGGTTCTAGSYCPNNLITRDQMAVFLLKLEHGSGYVPPPAQGNVFNDVPATAFAAAFIEQLSREGGVAIGSCAGAGTNGGNYCPTDPTTRGQMADFLTKTFHLKLYGP